MIKLSYKKLILALSITAYLLLANAAKAESAEKTLLVFGDSLVAGYQLPLQQAFPAVLEKRLADEGYNVKVINAGVSGDTTSGGLTRLEWNLEAHPDYALLELGANDMLRGIDPQLTYNNLNEILKTFKARHIPVLLAGMKARPNMGEKFVTSYLHMYEQLADEYSTLYYPFFLETIINNPDLLLDDGMHPNKQGVETIVESILPLVKELIGEK